MSNREDSIRDFTELRVWQKGMLLTSAIYAATRTFPRDEQFGLTSQLRRAASSIPTNFVEGFRKRTAPDKLRFSGRTREPTCVLPPRACFSSTSRRSPVTQFFTCRRAGRERD